MNVRKIIPLAGVLFLVFVSGCAPLGYKIGLADCAPVYGNWCGENYPLPGNNPPPVDGWDEACRDHDKCYEGGRRKSACDERFVEDLNDLASRGPVPQRMRNAHSWFREDGYFEGHINFLDELWAISADCEGGDGEETEFYCVNPYNLYNPYDQNYPYYKCALRTGSGRAGTPCRCGRYQGVIFEE